MFSPDAFFPVLEKVARVLDECGVRYHLTGGLVSIYYAEPRLTQDADLVVDPVPLQMHLDQFLEALQRLDYLANEETIRDAVKRGRMFQIIDSQEGLKVDLYPRELVPGALDRSILIGLTPDLPFPIASRPDLIASKLVWISKGSHKSRRDVKMLMRGATDDEEAVAREFAEGLGLTGLLDEVLGEPDEIE
ncbi:MAG: nucleotidyl transferase AbiEii/AbiGii toxin family protein [Planctomycetaceae bacterium]